VFVRTKARADRLAGKLARRHVDALALHGDMPQNARQRNAQSVSATARVRTLRSYGRRREGLRSRGHHARDQLRSARGRQGLRAPSRAHRSRGQERKRITFVLPDSRPTSAAWRRGSGTASSSSARALRVAPARRVYTSRPGRNSRLVENSSWLRHHICAQSLTLPFGNPRVMPLESARC